MAKTAHLLAEGFYDECKTSPAPALSLSQFLWGYSPMVTAVQPFTASQQCGYLILQLARFMWPEWAAGLVPSRMWRLSALAHCCTVNSMKGRRRGPNREAWHSRTRRCNGKQHSFIVPFHRYTSIMYPLTLQPRPVWSLTVREQSLQSLHVGVFQIVLTCRTSKDSRECDYLL